MSLLLRHFHQKPRAKLHESSTNCVPLTFYSPVPWNPGLGEGKEGEGEERTHKFSLFYSQRLVYIRNKREARREREERDKERKMVFGWSKQRREDTGGDAKEARAGGLRTNVSWKGKGVVVVEMWRKREESLEERLSRKAPSLHLLSPLSLSLVRSTALHNLTGRLLNRPCSPSLLIFPGKQRLFATNSS